MARLQRRLLADVPREPYCCPLRTFFHAAAQNPPNASWNSAGLIISDDELTKITATTKTGLPAHEIHGEQLATTAVAPKIIETYKQLCAEAGLTMLPNASAPNGAASPRQIDLDALAYEMFLQRWRGSCISTHPPARASPS